MTFHYRPLILAATLALVSSSSMAANFQVQMLNKGSAGAFVFEPALTRVAVGDTVTFVPTDKGHNAESVAGLLPDGAQTFKGATSQEISVTFTVPGAYEIKCTPHYGLGMVAVVVVGDKPANLDALKAANQPPKVAERLKAVFDQLAAL
jgi:pseudoazurin